MEDVKARRPLAWERNWEAYWDLIELGSRRSCKGHRCIGIEGSRRVRGRSLRALLSRPKKIRSTIFGVEGLAMDDKAAVQSFLFLFYNESQSFFPEMEIEY